jgi:hypothetical protein
VFEEERELAPDGGTFIRPPPPVDLANTDEVDAFINEVEATNTFTPEFKAMWLKYLKRET